MEVEALSTLVIDTNVVIQSRLSMLARNDHVLLYQRMILDWASFLFVCG